MHGGAVEYSPAPSIVRARHRLDIGADPSPSRAPEPATLDGTTLVVRRRRAAVIQQGRIFHPAGADFPPYSPGEWFRARRARDFLDTRPGSDLADLSSGLLAGGVSWKKGGSGARRSGLATLSPAAGGVENRVRISRSLAGRVNEKTAAGGGAQDRDGR